MKTKKDDDETDSIGLVYIKNKIELLWLIGLSMVCDKNQIGPDGRKTWSIV